MDEPSLLDYLKEKLSLKRLFTKQAAPQETLDTPEQEPVEPESQAESMHAPSFAAGLPWFPLAALLLALVGQRFLEPATRNLKLGIAFYLLAVAALVLAIVRKVWTLAPLAEQGTAPAQPRVRLYSALVLAALLLLSFFAFSGNKFSFLNIILWLAVIVLSLVVFWVPERKGKLRKAGERMADFFRHPGIHINFRWWDVLLLAVFALAAFYRLSQLNTVPLEMISDHAEKLLDVNDVLHGQTSIFFYRNTGREAFQFYLTALVSKVFGTGISFLSLKLGTALMGLVTLIYVYRLGKELGNRWVGLLAVLFMGMAYWLNVTARIGLRFALYPLFTAPLLFYLLRGLRRMQRNDFILAGIALGLGLQGYSTMRIVPFLVGILVLVFILHARQKENRVAALEGFLLVAFFALVFFLPLARFWSENPDMFGYRALSRLGTVERTLPGGAWQIFFTNFWKASIMPFWDNGNVWAHSVPYRPALDVVSAGLYLLGVVLALARYLKERRWQDLGLLLSIPVLMLPSILSLAFPEENPALNRTGAAAIPIFLLIALALEGLLRGLWQRAKGGFGRVLVVGLGGLLVLVSASQNYDLVFRQYASSYNAASWNTTQIGAVVREYIDSTGDVDSVWVVGIPYWVDTRLVGINSGEPEKDYAIWPKDFAVTLDTPAPKLFILRADDEVDIDLLMGYYPNGYLILHENTQQEKSFYSFVVPPED